MIKTKIKEKIADALVKLNIEKIDFNIEEPANTAFGDYATSLPLKLSKELRKNPFEIAELIAKKIAPDEFIEKIEAVKPGFVNFWISKPYLVNKLKESEKSFHEFSRFHFGINKKIIVEFAHPNTHKLFHIGHLRNITTGEAIVRILEAAGNKIVRANYQGDVGMHIAKCLWRIAKLKKEKGESLFKGLELPEKIKLLGRAYSEGNKAFEEDPHAKEEIVEINRKIYDKHPEIFPLWKETRQWSLDYFDAIYKRVYSHFDRFFFESELPKRGVEIAKEALEKNVLKKSEGAIVFDGKQYGLDTRVFINSLGLPTYEGKELALAEAEFKEFGDIDKCIHIVGPEQASFFKVTFKVEELLNPEKYKDKQRHLIYGWVRLKHGKMSSRSGNVVQGTWLLDEAKDKIRNKFKCDPETAEVLAVASVKYSFLKTSTANETVFDFDESVSIEGNSAPYLIYTYVRARSVLNKEILSVMTDNIKLNADEHTLLRLINKFPETVYHASSNLSPSVITTYLYDLAQAYNNFYQKNPILKSTPEIKTFRLALTKSVSEILKHGLRLLGIETVEHM